MIRRISLIFLIFFIAGCAVAPLDENLLLTQGPHADHSIKTPYDRLLVCLKDNVKGSLFKIPAIGVGSITDETGKFSIGDNGNGKYITQGAGDIVQSAVYQSGITRVVNRRDPRVMDMEIRHGRKLRWVASDYHITGSINSLDFIPGGGIDATVWGVGGKYRQYRMLIGLDLSLTNTMSSEVVHIASIFKQVVAEEVGFGVGRFFGETLVAIDIGNQNREAIHFATRNMLKLAVFELLANLYNLPENRCFTPAQESARKLINLKKGGMEENS